MNRRILVLGGIGCALLTLVAAVAVVMLIYLPFRIVRTDVSEQRTPDIVPVTERNERSASIRRTDSTEPQESVPTLEAAQSVAGLSNSAQTARTGQELQDLATSSNLLAQRYGELNPGVVNIGVIANNSEGQRGAGAGSGFVLDEQGHIVTNNHVIDQAVEVVVIFYNGLQAQAEIIGTDDDSDLAIIKVEELPEDVHPLPIADSDTVRVGDWAIAIGNPFGLGSSMTLGIVSAIGRSIPSGATPFAIPQAIQTDAAINPGNSGGPLLNLNGQVIGVNAQIRTGSGTNSGVGFAIPANVVRHIAPALIVNGFYEWPWLGVSGVPVGLTLMEANNLETQFGAYIASVVPGGPADEAGLRGAEIVERDGLRVPVGGDVVVAIEGEPIRDFDDLSSQIAFKTLGNPTVLTVIRDGQRQKVTVNLKARPSDFGQDSD